MARIPKAVKDATWKKYMGYKTEGKCYCCKMETISVFSFEVGHNKAKSKGGSNDIENLRPICKGCNTSMGTQSIESFRAKHFASNNTKLPSASKNIPNDNTIKKKPLTRQQLRVLTLTQLKHLASKHNIKISSTVWEDIWGNTTRKAPTKQQYINKLFGTVTEGEKLQD
jgi:hypothetical protein